MIGKKIIWRSIGLLGALTVMAGAGHALANDCVVVVGTDSGGPNLTMDPAFLNTDDDAYHLFAVYNRLLTLDRQMKIVPELAESWSVSNDGLTWTFKLRAGVKFHDGKDFGAKDVVYTFKRLIDPATKSPGASTLSFLKPDGIKALDDHTVTFTTDTPIANLPELITVKYSLIVPDGAKTEDLKPHGDGTGPFMQQTFTPSETKRVLIRNPHYWKAGLPRAKCLEMSVMTEEVPRTAALQSGDVDLILVTSAASVPQLKADKNVQLLISPPGTYYNLVTWMDQKPFADVRVRQAMKAVVDRQAMVDTVLLGFGEPGNDNPVPPSSAAAYTHELPKRDVAKAQQLLAAAGYPNGIDIDLYTGEGSPGLVKMAEAYQQMAADAGIRVNLIQNPADSYWDTVWNKKPFFHAAWSARTPAQALAYTYASDSANNESRWKRPDYDALLKQAREELDDAKRAEIYNKAQKMITEEGATIIPFFIKTVAAMRANCSGYQPHMQSNNLNYETLSCEGKSAQ
jgi:peptide/nickel transport system substrate-binding protein